MELISTGRAGTLESGDISIVVEKNADAGIVIDLDSTVASLFGREIKEVITKTLSTYGFTSGIKVTALDKGALNCTIIARVTAALYRAAGSTEFNWK
ncbi:citrate lyase acyl carrier protein [Anaerosinus massiliensis]|uniref:citrate lyase acyl carrier protein n=1 Tax=Massilibacillus massiliensis TaxID=1806837 RepID=UPI000DA61A38|nr:citrate lyase acyl carrier protein [Massilibacillus massiliensis]